MTLYYAEPFKDQMSQLYPNVPNIRRNFTYVNTIVLPNMCLNFNLIWANAMLCVQSVVNVNQ